jgi:hypothetical protein
VDGLPPYGALRAVRGGAGAALAGGVGGGRPQRLFSELPGCLSALYANELCTVLALAKLAPLVAAADGAAAAAYRPQVSADGVVGVGVHLVDVKTQEAKRLHALSLLGWSSVPTPRVKVGGATGGGRGAASGGVCDRTRWHANVFGIERKQQLL